MSKKWIIIGSLLITLGLIIVAAVMVHYGWDFSKLGTVNYHSTTHEIKESFENISINVNTTDIKFLKSNDNYCKVVCYESEKIKHSAFVTNGTLTVEVTDLRKWYEHIEISFGTPEITVYLPENEYKSLFAKTDTGDITLPQGFSFEKININGDTSDINCFCSVSDSARIETDTGDINLSYLRCEKISIDTDTGDVTLNKCDGKDINITTSTGDIVGSFASPKYFIAKSSTGNISVPKSSSSDKCQLTTSTGDINVYIED